MEFTSKAKDQWAYASGVKLDFSRPGTPTDNAYIESFNGRLRDECLNQHWFVSMEEASLLIHHSPFTIRTTHSTRVVKTSGARRVISRVLKRRLSTSQAP